MIEKVYRFTKTKTKTMEKVIGDDFLHYMHIVLNRNEGVNEHRANSNVYMTILKGVVNIRLESQDYTEYEEGTVLNIPVGTLMHFENRYENILELAIVKVPSPK